MTLPYPPPYQDIEVLCEHLSISPDTVDAWMRKGKLPPPKIDDGKRLWRWKDVEKALDAWGEKTAKSADPRADEVRDATRRALAAQSR